VHCVQRHLISPSCMAGGLYMHGHAWLPSHIMCMAGGHDACMVMAVKALVHGRWAVHACMMVTAAKSHVHGWWACMIMPTSHAREGLWPCECVHACTSHAPLTMYSHAAMHNIHVQPWLHGCTYMCVVHGSHAPLTCAAMHHYIDMMYSHAQHTCTAMPPALIMHACDTRSHVSLSLSLSLSLFSYDTHTVTHIHTQSHTQSHTHLP
jgi:hypothetical protein